MIRHTPFTCCLLVIAAFDPAVAQPTLIAGQYTPIVGDMFNFSACGIQTAGMGGAGQVWDFSSLPCFAPSFANYVDPASTTGGPLFPAATVAMGDAGAAQYYHGTATDLSYLGFAVPVNDVELCSDPTLLITYPFTYGSTFTDNFSCTETGAVYDRTRYGTTTVTADGYGTVILPYGTFTDCLRLHEVRDFIDAYMMLPDSGFVQRESYQFIQPGIHAPLFITSWQMYTQGGGSIVNEGSNMLDEMSTALQGSAFTTSASHLVPDPATERTELLVSSGDVCSVQICDVLGRGLRSWTLPTGAQRAELDLSGLPAGPFIVRVVHADRSEVLRLVKE